MREALVQSLENLRANKLRSCLTMFGILWGMISVVILSAGVPVMQQHPIATAMLTKPFNVDTVLKIVANIERPLPATPILPQPVPFVASIL